MTEGDVKRKEKKGSGLSMPLSLVGGRLTRTDDDEWENQLNLEKKAMAGGILQCQ